MDLKTNTQAGRVTKVNASTPGAEVTLTRVAMNAVMKTNSGPDGLYAFPNLQADRSGTAAVTTTNSNAFADKVFGGWELSTTFRVSSGIPFFFRSGTCNV